MKKEVRDLLQIIRFTETVSTEIQGGLTEDTIFSIIKKECAFSPYGITILLVTDESTVTIVNDFLPSTNRVENTGGPPKRDTAAMALVYSEVVKKGKTINVPLDGASESILQPAFVSEILGLKGESAILTPLKRDKKVIGVLAVSSTTMADDFIPSVENLAQHISTALALSHKYAEQKKAEKEVKKSEERFRALFESQGIGVALGKLDIPPTGKIVPLEVNAALLQFLGYTQEEFLEKTVADVSHPEDMKKDSALMNEVLLGTRDSYKLEKRFIKKDGSIVWGLMTVSALRDANGNPTHAISSVQDITEQKRAEEKLLYHANLLENVSDAVISTDLDFVIKTWNKAAESMYDWKAHEVIGKTVDETIKTAYPTSNREDIEKEFLEKGFWKGEVIQKKKDGSPINVYASVALIKDSTKTPVGAVAVNRDITEQKRAEKSLKESEEKYRDLVENLNDVIYTTDTKGVVTYMSPAIESFMGYTPEEMIGRHSREFVYKTDLPYLRENFSKIFSGEATESEYRVVGKSGDIHWIRTSSKPIMVKGRVTGVRGVSMDITERKKAEEEMRKAKEFTESIISSAQDGIVVVDLNGRFLQCNTAFLEMTGYTMDELERVTFYDLTPKKWIEQDKKAFKGLLEGVPVRNFEKEFIRKDSTVFPIVLSSALLTDEYGDPTAVMGIIKDSTEQKRAEDQLQKREQEFRLVFENAKDAIFWADLETGVLIRCNKAAESLLKRDRKDIIGHHQKELHPPEMADYYSDIFNQCASEGGPSDIEAEVITASEEIIPVRISSSVTRVGGVSVIQGIFRDITEHKKAEEALKWELSVNTALSKLYKPLISPSSSIEEIASIILDQAKQVTTSEHGYVSSIDPESGVCIVHTLTEMLAQCNVLPEKKKIVFFPEKDGSYPTLWGYSLNTRQPFFTNSPKMHPASTGVPEGHIPVQTFLSAPVLLGEELVGQIALANKKEYTQRDLDAICRFADVYAVAIQRMRAEEKLRENEERFRGIAERNFDVIFEADAKGCITYISPAIERITGYTPQEMVGTSFLTYVSEVGASPIQKTYMNLLEGNLLEAFQVKALKKDGSSALVEINASPVTKEGIVTGVQGVGRDITARKKAEIELRESEEKYRTLVESSTQGIAIAQGSPPRLVFVNTAFSEITGYTREELLSFPDSNLILAHAEDQAMCSDNYAARMAGGSAPSRYEFRLIRKDKTVRWLEMNISRIEYKGAPAAQAIFMDITERKKAEEKIKQSLREKEVLLREIHHRVKNNMQVISSLLNLQADHTKDKIYADMLKESQNRIQSMALIHEKLYQSENLANIDFEEYITSLVYGLVHSYHVAETVTPIIEVEDISLGIDAAIPCGLIINELVSNSLKHAFPGGRKGEITVKLRSLDSKVELIVADNGCGIPDTIDVKNTQTLGLDLVVTLAEEQLEGEITLDKTKGTVFCITFEVM